MRIRITFKVKEEAEAFAQRFHGSLKHRPTRDFSQSSRDGTVPQR
jgi:hypothetical protein